MIHTNFPLSKLIAGSMNDWEKGLAIGKNERDYFQWNINDLSARQD